VVDPEGPAVDHITDTTGGADDDVNTLPQLAHILPDVGSTNTGATLYARVVAESDENVIYEGLPLMAASNSPIPNFFLSLPNFFSWPEFPQIFV